MDNNKNVMSPACMVAESFQPKLIANIIFLYSYSNWEILKGLQVVACMLYVISTNMYTLYFQLRQEVTSDWNLMPH